MIFSLYYIPVSVVIKVFLNITYLMDQNVIYNSFLLKSLFCFFKNEKKKSKWLDTLNYCIFSISVRNVKLKKKETVE